MMWIRLITLCGCEREVNVDWDGPRRLYEYPIPVAGINDPEAEMLFTMRRFRFSGRDDRGLYVYREDA